MSPKNLFLHKISQIKNRVYIPKFKVGDYIYNSKFKIVRKVKGVEINSAMCELGRQAQYVLEDYKNELRQQHNMKYLVYKTCVAIDDYYELVDEKMIQVLYGKRK